MPGFCMVHFVFTFKIVHQIVSPFPCNPKAFMLICIFLNSVFCMLLWKFRLSYVMHFYIFKFLFWKGLKVQGDNNSINRIWKSSFSTGFLKKYNAAKIPRDYMGEREMRNLGSWNLKKKKKSIKTESKQI